MNHNKKGSQINFKLESLRGFAALFVVLGHVIEHHTFFDKNYFMTTLSIFFRNYEISHISVLIFFVLSGYVIGISNQIDIKKETIFNYLKKRFFRIYPIYFLCVIVTLIISTTYTLQMAVATFTITQGLLSKVIWENGPLWSLNYEVFYYLLFIPISLFNLSSIKVLVSSLFIAIVSHYIFPNFPILSSYFFGFLFWSAGWCIAKYLNKFKIEVRYNFLLAGLFYILSISALLDNCGLNKKALLLISKVFIYPTTSNWASVMIGVQDLILLPYCFCLVVVFAGIDFRYRNKLFLFLQIMPILGIYHIFRFGANDKSLICIMVYYTIAIGVFIFNTNLLDKFSSYIVKFGTWLGSISYGIYVIHFPILCVFGKFIFLSGSPFFFIIKVFLYLLITIIISVLLEKKYQYWVKSILTRRIKIK